MQTLTADLSKAKYLCKMHLVAGSMLSSTLMKTDVFYTLSGKAGETETSDRVRRNLAVFQTFKTHNVGSSGPEIWIRTRALRRKSTSMSL